MSSIQFTFLPAPELLKNDVECLRIAHQSSGEAVSIKVAPSAVPGIVFCHNSGQSAIEQIITQSRRQSSPPPLFLCGAGIEPSVMHFKAGSFTTIHVIFKPCALKTLFGINASHLADGFAELNEFSTDDLSMQMVEASNEQQRLTVLTSFLLTRLKQENPRDLLIEESLRSIQQNSASLHVKDLLSSLNISERQFERRFKETVGVSPHSYIRVKRFHEAIRLIKARQFERLTDVASALNYYDQSHLIREIKAFSLLTPKRLARRVDDFYHEQAGYSYRET